MLPNALHHLLGDRLEQIVFSALPDALQHRLRPLVGRHHCSQQRESCQEAVRKLLLSAPLLCESACWSVRRCLALVMHRVLDVLHRKVCGSELCSCLISATLRLLFFSQFCHWECMCRCATQYSTRPSGMQQTCHMQQTKPCRNGP